MKKILMTHAEMRALYAEPVPPAGGESELPQRQNKGWQCAQGINPADGWNAACDAWAPHVTRLQAEVTEQALYAASEARRALRAESELTKARELLEEARQELLHEERFAIAHSIMTFLSKKVG